MRSTHVSFCLFAFALGAAVPALRAQDTPPAPPPSGDQGGPPPSEHHRSFRGLTLDALKEHIPNLTDAQLGQIGQILDDTRKQARDLRDDSSLSDDDRREKMRDIMTSTRAKIRALLNPDQQKAFDQLGARRRHRQDSDDGSQPPPPPPPPPPSS